MLRWTPDPAPRMLLCFDEDERGTISLSRLAARVKGKDIDPNELVIGSVFSDIEGLKDLKDAGVTEGHIHKGIKEAVADSIAQVKKYFGTKTSS